MNAEPVNTIRILVADDHPIVRDGLVAILSTQPDLQVVFFAVGFETTAPATALAVQQAKQLELPNFSLLVRCDSAADV